MANPTFFAARSDAERCAAIGVWLSSIRDEAGRTRADLNQVQVQEIRRMSVPAFRGVFGKTFAEMSSGERKDVARALKKCSKESWVEWALAHPFKLPEGGDAKGWVEMFERYDRSGLAEMRARARRADAYVSNETPEAELKRRVYFVGDLLLETGLYKLYANNYTSDFDRRYGDGKGWEWCHPDKRAALVTIIFKGDERFEVRNDEAYWARFEKEVVPAVLARCPAADTVYAGHHVDGFYVYYGRRVGREPSVGNSVEPVSRASYQLSARKRSWTLFQPGGSWGVKADDTVTSIAAIREILKVLDATIAAGMRAWDGGDGFDGHVCVLLSDLRSGSALRRAHNFDRASHPRGHSRRDAAVREVLEAVDAARADEDGGVGAHSSASWMRTCAGSPSLTCSVTHSPAARNFPAACRACRHEP